jgi:hypothetical protein
MKSVKYFVLSPMEVKEYQELKLYTNAPMDRPGAN